MEIFDVYPILDDIELVKSKGIYVFDKKGHRYLDFYGGHAVISIGHSHPYYVRVLTEQIKKISYYSNSVFFYQKKELAHLLGRISGYENYSLFLCNSGSESNENALKIASFHTGKKKVVAFKGSFHGRTSGSVSVTDNYKFVSTFNAQHETIFIDYKDISTLEKELKNRDICAVITEGIQGLSGIIDPGFNFFCQAWKLCRKYDTIFIIDEVQSGYGRTGSFFAHQLYPIKPDLITIAKGMGNGFPIGGVLIHPRFKPYYGMLGTTFGGNPLACVAGISVLEIIQKENLIENARKMGKILLQELRMIPKIKKISGRGLMLGLEFDFPIHDLKNILIYREKVFVGTSNNSYILRLLPPLSINVHHIKLFITKLKRALAYL
ncbi:MAG: aminotransferase class III-fold pyridoxal phosphate-dependent enzyme [Flavobacteriales bacterium]|jgi:acetylornithine aminotransferase|uniref:aspartate aminotransferase family protein n=1 Tax=Blattabacterium sp. (Mastotermes darwiniensis) TaxID=39768 RepID=UPI000231DE2D|nr:aminotransferase class III-fold pyridoxal phosphate-dependent enzyme [Blattabacterium sp. (Mastotermes darwiniensis)]AER40609.1 acetylornithine aminotransferase [Blattabacterium sp. (Mastotermes darwiniensis) str. MADAR]MDR1805106.1 aminotransferase class III-fold pyridoxal phosphate-dependent enzyme [Flavobacteriales bacterium]